METTNHPASLGTLSRFSATQNASRSTPEKLGGSDQFIVMAQPLALA
jgi:hypothetical protein